MSPALVLLLGCASRAPAELAVAAPADPPPVPTETVASPAPARSTYPVDYAPPDLTGQPMAFSRWQGRVVLVNLWASWCPPCLEELPALRELHASHGPRGLVVLGVAVDDSVAGASQAYLERELTWPVAMDQGSSAGPVFGTNELPTTLLYAPDGRQVWKHVGPLQADDPDLAAALAQLLGG